MMDAHPAFAALEPWLPPDSGVPTLAGLNAAIAAGAVPPHFRDEGRKLAQLAAKRLRRKQVVALEQHANVSRRGRRHGQGRKRRWL